MQIDLWGLLVACGILFWRKTSRLLPLMKWYFPNMQFLPQKTSSKTIIPFFSKFLGLCVVLFLSIALINPSFPMHWVAWSSQKPLPRDGRVIDFLMDVSGSMAEPFNGTQEPKIEVAKKTLQDLMKALTKNQENRQNLYGLSSFARASYVDCPLTYDHTFVEKQAQSLQPITQDAMNGTALGYALFKSVQQILATSSYALKSGLIEIPPESYSVIIISDGIEDPHPLDREDPFRSMSFQSAVLLAQNSSIRVYFISVEASPDREFTQELNTMSRWIEGTKGRLFKAGPSLSIQQIVASIQDLEAQRLPAATLGAIDLISLRWVAASFAMLLLMIKLVLDFITSRCCT